MTIIYYKDSINKAELFGGHVVKVDNINSSSFKGSFLLIGQTDVLGEICWYMQRKQREPLNNFGFIDLRNSFYTPPKMVGEEEMVDLFITDKDKNIIEPKLVQILYETLDKKLLGISLIEKAKYLMDNLAALQESISRGKPIEGLNKSAVTKYLKESIKVDDINIMSAEEAFGGIQKGTFDIKEGIIK